MVVIVKRRVTRIGREYVDVPGLGLFSFWNGICRVPPETARKLIEADIVICDDPAYFANMGDHIPVPTAPVEETVLAPIAPAEGES